MQRGMRNLTCFEACVEYCFAPKHTVGEQLLDVRRNKKEREAFATAGSEFTDGEGEGEEDDAGTVSYPIRNLSAGTEPGE